MSEKTKFTPGPWFAECVGSGGAYDNPVDVYEVTNQYTRIAEGIFKRDAHLIAAAPELYEALEAALPVMERRAPDFDVVNAAIRAALKKARGES